MTIDTLEALREARAYVASALDEARHIGDLLAIAGVEADLSRIDAALASDHIGNSTTMVPALGVEGVAQIIRQHLNAPVSSCALLDIDEAARAIIAARGKKDGATLGVAQIKATIWKHWRNQNGQTLEDRFTSAAEEIAAMEKNDG